MRLAARAFAATFLAGCNAVSGVGELRFDEPGESAAGPGGTGGSSTSTVSSASGGATTGSGGSAQGGSAGAPAGTGGSGGSTGSGGSGGVPVSPDIYASTHQSLYRFDVGSRTVTKIADFLNGCEVDEIALRDDGSLFGVTTALKIVTIDVVTGQCVEQSDVATKPWAMHFNPGQSLDVSGFENDDHLVVQLSSGAIAQDNDVLAGYIVSGDSVAVGAKSYVTVDGGACNDCVVEVSPNDGSIIDPPWSVGGGQVYGLAASGAFLFGFTSSGKVLRIDPMTKTATQVADAAVFFSGAASLSSAP